jgi:hypothetical protein
MIEEKTIMVFLENTGAHVFISNEEKDCLLFVKVSQSFGDKPSIRISELRLDRTSEGNVVVTTSMLTKNKVTPFDTMKPAFNFMIDSVVSSISKHFRKVYSQGYIFSSRDYSIMRDFLASFIMHTDLEPREEIIARNNARDMERLKGLVVRARLLAQRIGLDASDIVAFENKYFSKKVLS